MRRAADPLPPAPDPWVASSMPAFRGRPPYLMTEMIAAEPALAERVVRRLRADGAVADLAAALAQANERRTPILITGCGTSEHAAAGIAALLTESLGRDAGDEVRCVPALDLARRPPAAGVVVAVSHEGGTTATNEALRAARDAGARTAIVTVGSGSPGAAAAELVVMTGEQDQSWCHTVGYLSPLLAGVVIASRVAGSRLDAVAIHSLLEVATEPRAAADAAAGLTGIDRLIVAGTGQDWPATRELALKVAEGARLPADAVELETLLHGTLAAATRWTGLVVIASDPTLGSGLGRDRLVRLLEAGRALAMPAAGILGEMLHADLDPSLTPAGRMRVPGSGRVRGVAASLLGPVIPLQLLAERLARARGVNPDTLGREDAAQAAAHG